MFTFQFLNDESAKWIFLASVDFQPKTFLILYLSPKSSKTGIAIKKTHWFLLTIMSEFFIFSEAE